MLKEIRLALANGFKVTVLCFGFNNWSKEMNDRLMAELSTVNWIVLLADRKPFLPWAISVLAEKGSRMLSRLKWVSSSRIISTAISRRSYLLLSALPKNIKPDWVIGHNPGALYVSKKAAELYQCRAGFDVEDYHPGEGRYVLLQELTRKLMKEQLPHFDYLSFAAPLIQAAVQRDLQISPANWITVLNSFPKSEFVKPSPITGRLKLVWFSQNISEGRGLELVIPVVREMQDTVELHLFGSLDAVFFQGFEDAKNVVIHPPVSQQLLHQRLMEFDIGLALEIPVDQNREYCLTNKLLAYMQAGLFIIGTNTEAQVSFLKQFPSHGTLFDYQDPSGFSEKLQASLKNITGIRNEKNLRFDVNETFNWETESAGLKEQWMLPYA